MLLFYSYNLRTLVKLLIKNSAGPILSTFIFRVVMLPDDEASCSDTDTLTMLYVSTLIQGINFLQVYTLSQGCTQDISGGVLELLEPPFGLLFTRAKYTCRLSKSNFDKCNIVGAKITAIKYSPRTP